MSAVRSIRQNNWPNIKVSARNRWVGKMPLERGDDRRFERFEKPEHGVRACAMLLQRYFDTRGADTIEKVLAIYAPKGAENPSHDDYVAHVAQAVGVRPGEELDLHQWAVMAPMVRAIVEFEQGRANLPAGYQRVVEAGVAMSGILPPAKGLLQSRTMAGNAVAAVGGLGAPAAMAAQAMGVMTIDAPWWVVGGAVLMVLVGAATVLWAYLDDRARLRRSLT
jgi:hypothetical protein